MKKILFVAAHRLDRSPSQRYRFEQYFKHLEANGYHCDLAFIISEKDDQIFYGKGRILYKFYVLIKAFFLRLSHVFKSRHYDLVFIQREAFMTGTILFEKLFKRFGPPIIFDYDDAIWLPNVSEGNKKLSFLKKPEKTKDIIELADMSFAGNSYLKDFGLSFNNNINIVPTTINTDWYTPVNNLEEGKICIGWTGSGTTIQHFEKIVPILAKIKSKFVNQIRFKVIGDPNYQNDELEIKGVPWKSLTEVKDLSEIDIGVMPLPDNKWTMGKCGCKGLQYMAMGIPTIMSPVGVNTDIIEHGVNGFTPETDEEWVDCLTQLIEDINLRKSFGEKGRQTVIDKFSVESQKSVYLKHIKELIN